VEEQIKDMSQVPEPIEGVILDAAAQESPPPPAVEEALEPEIIEAATSEETESQEEDTPADPKDVRIAELDTQLAEQIEMVDAIKRQHGEAIVEFNNARTRLKREVSREVQNSLKSLIGELLETLDNLDRAIEAASSKSEESELLTGVTMVRDQFIGKLSQLGVKRINSKDAKFDPNIHEAVAMVPVPTPDLDGQIMGIIKEGYTMNDEVLRAAVVAVGQCATAEEPDPSPEEVPTENAEESATE